jgi:hypothetical protein
MIETVAIQDDMTQQTSLLDHSEEQVQQGNGDNYKNAHGSSITSQISTKSDDGKWSRKWTSCLGLKFISIDIEVFW